MASSGIGRFLRRLEADRQAVAGRLATAVRAGLPEYGALPNEAVAQAIAIDLEVFLKLLEEDREPTAAEAQRSLDIARVRGRAGFSVTAFLESFNVARREALAMIGEVARELRIGVADRRRIERRVGDWVGLLMVQASRAFLELAGGDRGSQQQREALLRDLLDGRNDAEARSRAALFGLDATGRYRALAGAPGADATAWDLLHAVARTGGRGATSALVAESGAGIFGLVATIPRPSAPGDTLALGPAVPLAQAARSWSEARRVMDAARAAGRTGVVTLGDVAFESAMHEDPERSAALAARWVEPLMDDGVSGARVLETVERWIANGASVQQTAEALGVHPNTVRYRLQVYRDRVGDDLASFDARCRAWWALRWCQTRAGG